MPDAKYPEIVVQLVGQNGNAFAIMGAVQKALRRGGVAKFETDMFLKEATGGDYDHLLRTCLEWVTVE